MSKSFKGEDRRAAAQAHRARRTARLDKFLESHDSKIESSTKRDRTPQCGTMDANPKPSPRVPA
jgi:hypothetical protein